MANLPRIGARLPRQGLGTGPLVAAFAFLSLVFFLGACATVEPWERGRLAHPAMDEGRAAEATNMTQHEAGAREGALAPGASGGGGCGCN